MRNNKKGFTIVELVIVIAVIAILAAVLIPTFNSVITKANQSKAMQKAREALVNLTAEEENSNLATKYLFEVVDGSKTYYFEYTKSTGEFEAKDTKPTSGFSTTAVAAAKLGNISGVTAYPAA